MKILGTELAQQAHEQAMGEAQQQIRHGADGAKKVQTWQRLNAYWWLRNGRGSTADALMSGVRRVSTWPTFMRETHARLLTGDRVKTVEKPKAEFKFAAKLHELLDDLPEWERLVDRCRGDRYNAESAAAGLVQRMAEHVPEHEHDVRQARRALDLIQDSDLPPSSDVYQLEQLVESGEAEAEGFAGAMDPSAIRQAMRAALKETAEHFDEMDRAAMALGWGSQDAGAGEDSASETKTIIAEKLAASPKLAEILELAGRMKNIMREVQATKTRRGVNEVTDIEMGRDLQRLLPSELMMLRHPMTRLVLMRKLCEDGALQYRLEAEEKLGKGPVVICIDDSGSMKGTCEVWSKAVALAMLELARRQERPFAYCTFSRAVTHSFVEDPGKKTAPGELLDHLMAFHGGGTDFDAPLTWALNEINRHEGLFEADVIFISDGQCRASEEVLRRVAEVDAQVWGVAVGPAATSQKGEGSMDSFCEIVWPIGDIATDEGEEQSAVRGVLSI